MKTQFKKLSGTLLLLLLLFGLTGSGQTIITPAVTASCQTNTGAVTFTVTNGTGGPYTFYLGELSPPYTSHQGQSSPTFTNLAPGEYQVYLLGSNDSATAIFTIPSVVNVTKVETNTPCPATTGSIVTTTTGGTGSYTYHWSNGATTANLSNLGGGVFNLTVTDGNGCVADIEDTIYATSAMTIMITPGGSSCNPILTALATGGTGSVTYGWSNQATSAAITNLTSNVTYTVTAFDANGCTATNSYTPTITPLRVDSNTSVVNNPSCTANSGSIAINMNNGTAPFSYLWTNGATTGTISGLASGQYEVTVTDVNGCSGTGWFDLNYQSTINLYITQEIDPNCGQSNGSLSVNNAGVGVTYVWSNGGTSLTISNLAAGTYNVTASSTDGCTATTGYSITGIPGFSVSVTSTPTACDTSLHTGSITAIVTGTGVAPYSFVWTNHDWNNGTNTVIGTTQTVSNLGISNGYISLVVTDAIGCTTSRSDTAWIHLDPSCFDHITGNVFNDANGNCTLDAGETGISNATIIVSGSNGSTYFGNPDSSGFYDVQVLPGTYLTTINFWNNGACTLNACTSSYTSTFTTTGQISSGNNFGLNSGAATFDLGVHMGYQGSAPGQSREYWVYYYNYGQTSVANGTLTFVHDPNITLTSTTPAYTSYDAATYTITWDIVNNLGPMQGLDEAHRVIMYFDIPNTVTLGTELTAQAGLLPVANDCDPTNNYQSLTDVVSASHDPNHKEVSPSGNLSAADSVLTYTIRFQNTGNAAASLVVISDTLSPNVDPASVQPGASSSPYTWKLSGNGILTFTFEPINLVDSSQSVAGSEGFVMYTIKTKPNLPLGTQINNTAYIYFDANQPVVTNTTTSLRSNNPTGIHSITGGGAMTSQVIPNPVHNQARIEFGGSTGLISIKLVDELGNVIATGNFDNQYYTLDAEKLASGIYFYTAKDAAGNVATGKISVVR